ncbi:EamA family transporter RarD [Falsibacillus albus]|uniref:EamA family transporter RarD n=1 Tax=Falsibacillus albus TaxID=2478915 RepID=A0A3L7KB85_9BACI|nr:EamA family transporter RarD [Falsibacillus albus]RLQ97932.1 EamA family transporter RarD [Falsibacillus albus]
MDNQHQRGILYTAFSYFIWGILPVYWKFLHHVSSDEILANRIFWSFWFMAIILLATRKLPAFFQVVKTMKMRTLAALILASLLVSCNWFIYIWAVNSNQMVEASLGYYINPLVSVLLGIFILRETMSKAQIVSFILAAVGVLILTISYGQFPWIAFGLAFSFGLYGLAKKMIKVDSAIGLTLETMVVAPFAFIYMIWMANRGNASLFNVSPGTDLLLMGAGAATAIPLLFFAKGAQRIPLYMVGFLQYIAPTLTLILGVFIYREPFSKIDMISFLFIWGALAIFTASRVKWFKKKRLKQNKSLSA